jgi:hypothetical protein
MLPRLTAEDSLATRERLAVGTGALESEAAQRIVKSWIHQADPARAMAPRKRNLATVDALAAMGIEVVTHG